MRYISEFHKELHKYLDDEELIIDIMETVQPAGEKEFIRLIANGWKPEVDFDLDAVDLQFVRLTKDGESKVF